MKTHTIRLSAWDWARLNAYLKITTFDDAEAKQLKALRPCSERIDDALAKHFITVEVTDRELHNLPAWVVDEGVTP